MARRRLSVATMLAFGIGEASGAFKNMAWGVLLLFFHARGEPLALPG